MRRRADHVLECPGRGVRRAWHGASVACVSVQAQQATAQHNLQGRNGVHRGLQRAVVAHQEHAVVLGNIHGVCMHPACVSRRATLHSGDSGRCVLSPAHCP